MTISIFSQNVPIDIILSYQEEVDTWLQENSINIGSEYIKYSNVDLFIKPYISRGPQPRIFGRGGSIIDCFGVGKFLTKNEVENIYTIAYSCIPQEDKNKFIPFRTIENFVNSLVFNPKIIYDLPGDNPTDIDGEFAYLVFYFGSYLEQYPDTVYEIQFNQLMNRSGKNFFISPYGWYYLN